jgi:hypothetical protein
MHLDYKIFRFMNSSRLYMFNIWQQKYQEDQDQQKQQNHQ